MTTIDNKISKLYFSANNKFCHVTDKKLREFWIQQGVWLFQPRLANKQPQLILIKSICWLHLLISVSLGMLGTKYAFKIAKVVEKEVNGSRERTHTE